MFKQLEPLLTKPTGRSSTATLRRSGTRTSRRTSCSTARVRLQAYYIRPSYLANFLKIQNPLIRRWIGRWISESRTALLSRGNRRYLPRCYMLSAISRYGARVLPNTEQVVAGCKARASSSRVPRFRTRSRVRPAPGARARRRRAHGRMAFYTS
jgi:hypothetical protein